MGATEIFLSGINALALTCQFACGLVSCNCRGFFRVTGPSIALCMQCWHYASMAIQITIRDVPEKVRDQLAVRAALQGKSMQEYLRAELERLVARPSVESWLEQVRKRKRAAQTRISSGQILQNRDADRR